MKRLLWIGAAAAVLLAGLGLFDYFYYSPPRIDEAQIRQEAEKELAGELPDYLSRYMGNYVRSSIDSLEVLDIKRIDGKTYLVFKADIKLEELQPGYLGGFQGGRYMLGLRLVEGQLGGIKLKGGMEFTTELLGGSNPAECGQVPEGVFFAFCKDPRVDKATLEMSDGSSITAQAHNRTILAQVPEGQTGITPRFYDNAGVEIEPSYGMRLAFVSQNEDYYRQYSNYPMEWWNMKAEEIEVLTPTMVNGIWVFPDQQKDILEEERAQKLLQLIDGGIPVIFVGMKDFTELAAAFDVDGSVYSDPEVPADEVEAIYISKNQQGLIEAGAITLADEQDSPVLIKTINLRYQLDLPEVTRSEEDDESEQDIDIKEVQATPQPVPQVEKPTTVKGGNW